MKNKDLLHLVILIISSIVITFLLTYNSNNGSKLLSMIMDSKIITSIPTRSDLVFSSKCHAGNEASLVWKKGTNVISVRSASNQVMCSVSFEEIVFNLSTLSSTFYLGAENKIYIEGKEASNSFW